MLAFVLMALSLSLLVVLAIFVLAFVEGAFGKPQPAPVGRALSQGWQPPMIHDKELVSWAAEAAKNSVRRRLSSRRTATTAMEIAAELHAGVNSAIGQLPREVDRDSVHACSSCRHQWIAVMAPEALSIAETLRTKSPLQVNRIRERAIENSRRVANLDQRQYAEAKLVCPLFCDGSCAANGMRPLHCCGWRLMSGEQGNQDVLPVDGASIDPHAYCVSQGARDGLARELQDEGLDGNRYELNSALIAALDTPDAAARWANGEGVFEGCQLA